MAPASKKSRGSTEYLWSKEKTSHLIQLYESHSDLWNVISERYSDRAYKQKLQGEIAAVLTIDVKDVAAKLHNLRCQYNAELRKLNQKKSGAGLTDIYIPRWEYFNSLKFLSNSGSQSSSITYSNLSTNDVDKSAEENVAIDSTILSASSVVPQTGSFRKKKSERMLSSQKDAIMDNAIKILSNPADSHQIFGDFVADQMRGMSDSKWKRLRLIIQKAIIEIEAECDDPITLPSAIQPTSSMLQGSHELDNDDPSDSQSRTYDLNFKSF